MPRVLRGIEQSTLRELIGCSFFNNTEEVKVSVYREEVCLSAHAEW